MNPAGPWAWATFVPSAHRRGRLLRLAGNGHPGIRARHHKTMEFSPASSISGRATCVVAVSTDVVSTDVVSTEVTSRPATGIAGPVGIVLTAGTESAELTAVANPNWRPGETAVVRRSSSRLPGTLATDADLSAADLPRELVARLSDPDTRLDVTVEARARHGDGRAGLVLLWADATGGTDDRLAAELAAADLVIAEDAAARELALTAGVADGARALRWPGDAAVRQVSIGELDRILVLATADLPGTTVPELLSRPDLVKTEVAGLPPPLAAAAASARRSAVHLAGRLQARQTRGALRRVPATAQLVFTAPVQQLPELFELIAATREITTGVLLLRPGVDPWASWAPIRADDLAGAGSEVVCCLDGADDEPGLDDVVAALTRRLAADGVPTKTLAAAVAAVQGWPRGRAYDTVTRLRADAPEGDGDRRH
ncbi:MAG TPA: DUF371 domain-containing protein [Pseudonocardiaceae bacterium]|jgi:hypothetical protein